MTCPGAQRTTGPIGLGAEYVLHDSDDFRPLRAVANIDQAADNIPFQVESSDKRFINDGNGRTVRIVTFGKVAPLSKRGFHRREIARTDLRVPGSGSFARGRNGFALNQN